MSQDHVSYGGEHEQTEQELFDSLLNLDATHNYDDVWQPDPSYQFAQPDVSVHNIADNHTFTSEHSSYGQRLSLDLSQQSPLDSWQPNPLFQRPVPPRRSTKPSRGLPRKKSTYFTPRIERGFTPTSIDNLTQSKPFNAADFPGQSDPLQRWQELPADYEPASMSAINRALEDEIAPEASHATPWSPKLQPRSISAPTLPNSFHTYRHTSSRASSESGLSETSQNSTTSTRSHSNRARLKARRTAKAKVDSSKVTDKEARRFKCTFCCDDFRTKYDWSRHEKSLHLDLEEWRCCPHGSMVFSTITDRIHCAYCNALDPSLAHLESHNYAICDNPESPTTFHRKDHLVQHLRLAHHLESLPLLDDWKMNSTALTSRCGFCNQTLNTWDERTAHLSEHFRAGFTMAQWRGDHGFDAAITAKVRNNIPPYIIGDESRALVPFKAGDAKTQDHYNQISRRLGTMNLGQHSNADLQTQNASGFVSDETSVGARGQVLDPAQYFQDPSQVEDSTSAGAGGYLDMLTRHLGRFAREQMLRGVVPTDEMFQNEARKVIYDGNADGWDTTIADNDYWLASFKEQFGTNDLG